MGMGLNFGLQRLAPNVVTAPKSNIDYNTVLGLKPSQYEGLRSVGDTGYYYGDNKMYEPYTPSPVQYGRMIMGQFSPVTGPFGTPYKPYYGIGGNLSGGVVSRGGATAGTITRGNQSFRPVDVDVTGFTKTKPENSNIYEYAPSMAYVYSQMRPQITAQPNVMAVNAPGYQRASQMLTSPMATGSGAGRFLNTGNLLGFNFTPAQTTTTTSNA